jgi:beta-lactamase superfamily II metal-dependent hydrolase
MRFLTALTLALTLASTLTFLFSCQLKPSLSMDSDFGSRASPASNTAADLLKFIFFDVGEGDATLVYSSPEESMLIDAGPQGAGRNVILPFLKSEGISNLKYIVATHYHADHIGGIPEVVKGEDGVMGTSDDYKPTSGFIDRGGEYEGEIYEEYDAAAGEERIAARPGDEYSIGDASVKVLAADGAFADGEEVKKDDLFDENSASLALLITQDNFKYLHASDITGGGGEPPYQTADLETHLGELAGDIDVLRVAHHGSKTSTSSVFLEAVDPEAAVISAGSLNEFGHPHAEVIQRLINSGADVYLTEQGWLDEEYLYNESVHIQDGPISLQVTNGDWFIE